MGTREARVSEMIGLTVTHVDVTEDLKEVLITCEDKKYSQVLQWFFHHKQDCCEVVKLKSYDGGLAELVGYRITGTSEQVRDLTGEGVWDSATETIYTFMTSEATVVTKWLGESNGYYSEEVSLTCLFGDSLRVEGKHGC